MVPAGQGAVGKRQQAHDLRLIDSTKLSLHPPGWLEHNPGKSAKSSWAADFTKGWGDSECSALSGAGFHEIDVMVLYTPEFNSQFAGDSAARNANIKSSINQSNQILADSGIQNARFRLVHTDLAPSGYNEFGVTSLTEHINWLGNEIAMPFQAPFFAIAGNAAVNALADSHFADVVILAVLDGEGACGASRVNRRDIDWQGSPNAGFPIFPDDGFVRAAYGVVSMPNCGIGFMDFTHELGHMVGLEHDPANSETTVNFSVQFIYPNETVASPVCDGAYGHRFSDAPGYTSLPDERFRTVMSYFGHGLFGSRAGANMGCEAEISENCQGIPIFSNPNLEWAGSATGVQPLGTTPGARPTGTTGVPFPANNAQVFAQMAEIAAAYRSDPDIVYKNGFEGISP